MKFKFTKMHGIGNDFVVINGYNYKLSNYNKLAFFLCRRHFGIGGDGLIIVLPPVLPGNDFRMRMFNTDGSEAEMCGNGIRCFAHFVWYNGLTKKKILNIETQAGIKPLLVIDYNYQKSQIRVDMGKPIFTPDQIPVNTAKFALDSDYIREYNLQVGDKTFAINCVSMGNPHTVIFLNDIDHIPLEKWGSEIEHNPFFPERTNVEFVQIIKRAEIKTRVWERGNGPTLACGTGACASVVAGIKNGYLDNDVFVHLPGGVLLVDWSGDHVMMTGPAEIVYEGSIEIEEVF
jgi:diaminopimelate epimerase